MSSFSLPEVVRALNPIADKWFELGIQLRLPVDHLKLIENQYASESRRLTETVALWIKANNKCHWSSLADAIERIGVYNILVRELRGRDDKVLPSTESMKSVPRQHNSDDHDTGYSSSPAPESLGTMLSTPSDGDCSSGSEIALFDCVPGCGCSTRPCSLYTVIAGRCPNPTGMSVPLIKKNMPAVNEKPERKDETAYIEEFEMQTKHIQKIFANLVTDTCHSFKVRNVGTRELILLLQNSFPVMKTRIDEMIEATCLEQVFKITVDQACSWFEYEVIKVMVAYFGGDEDRMRVREYEAHFQKYAERRLPKGMKYIEVGSGARRGGNQLVIKIDKEWEEVTFSDLDKIRESFASALGVRRRDLYLADIREGCIMLRFMIVEELAGRLCPSNSYLTSSQIKSLRNEGVISLRCEKLRGRSVQKRALSSKHIQYIQSDQTGV